MTHKFESVNKHKLDNEWRRENLPPIPTLKELGLVQSDLVADIGCGIGYFTIAAAEIINTDNKVFALDTSEEMLDELDKRALEAEATNIISIKTGEYDFKLPDESITFALLVNVLHEIEDKERFILEVKRILKPESKFAIIEWSKEKMEMGPPINHRIGKEVVIELLNSTGFHMKDTMQFANAFYGLVFLKGEK